MARALDGARQKLAWGRHHAKLFDQETQRLYGPKGNAPFTIDKEFDPKKGCFRVRVKTINEDTGNLPLILGDAFHNFRSALDHVAWQLARRQQGRIPRSMVSFPIAPTRQRFHSPTVWTQLWEIGPRERETIENLQPYRQVFTGDVVHALALLSARNNQDKHRLLHVVNLANNEMSVDTFGPKNCEVLGFELLPGIVNRPLKPKMELFRIMVRVTGDDPNVGLHMRGGAKIALDDGSGVGLHTRLEFIAKAVDNVIRSFEPVFTI